MLSGTCTPRKRMKAPHDKNAPAASVQTGYLSPLYALSLSELGDPVELTGCGGWLLKRRVPGIEAFDAMGCYPIFSCCDWSGLHNDLEQLKGQLACVSMVTDPFGEYDLEVLRLCFPDMLAKFKDHCVTDLAKPDESFVSNRNRDCARAALREVDVQVCANPVEHLHEWVTLYGVLVRKHRIRGVAEFSEAAFLRQLQIPGLTVFRAVHRGETVCMTLWYAQGDAAYYHLGASSLRGYELKASYGVFKTAIAYFRGKDFRWLNLGAGAGQSDRKNDGLLRFKRGWSSGTRAAYLCGIILDDLSYNKAVGKMGVAPSGYFPAYREGEFA